MGDAGLNEVGAGTGSFGDHIGSIVDDVGIVAGAALHRIGATATGKGVVGAVADDEIGEAVSGTVDGRAAREREILEIAAEGPGNVRDDGIGAGAGAFGHGIPGADVVGVVARPANESIGASTAVEDVVGAVAGKGVGEVVAGTVDRTGAGQSEILDIGGQGMGNARLHQVGALIDHFDNHVAGIVDHVGIVAGAAGQTVGTGIPGQHVGEIVAGAVDVRRSGQGQVFDIGGKGIGDARLNEIGTLGRNFRHDITRVIDDIGVVAGAADQGVGTGAAGQGVVAGVAGQDVGEAVAGSVDGTCARQRQVFDVGGQRVGHARLHEVGTGPGTFGDHIGGVIDDIGVVAGAADQGIGPGAAVEHVAATVASQRIGEGIAGAVDVCRAGQGQVLDVGGERVGHTGLHEVGAGIGAFGNDIACVVHPIGVVAGTADQGVGTGAAVQGVVAAIAGEQVGKIVAGAVDGTRSGQGQVLDVGSERVRHARLDEIGPFAHVFDDHVARGIDDVGVVAGTADHRVVAGSA